MDTGIENSEPNANKGMEILDMEDKQGSEVSINIKRIQNEKNCDPGFEKSSLSI